VSGPLSLAPGSLPARDLQCILPPMGTSMGTYRIPVHSWRLTRVRAMNGY